MDLNNYPAPHVQTASQIVDGEAVVVLADAGEVNVLNPVATHIWALMDGTRTVQQIIHSVVAEFEVTPPEAQHDVIEFIETLVQEKMIELRAAPL
jgi:coenzyme PQQ biosynthesis protein PqqD